MVRRVRVIACGMLAREALAVRDLGQLAHLEVECLPAAWHFAPERIVPGVKAAVAKARRDGVDRILVGYADCGTGGLLDAACREMGVDRLPGPHCFALYQGEDMAEIHEERDVTAFYVTDFLARQPNAFLFEPLGLNRHPELAEMYFGSYERVVFLAQTEDDELTRSARDIAARLGLSFERRFTGYGDLLRSITNFAQANAGSAPSAP